ncbi:hypothetical protein CSUI_004308, partial [Cystoisospora suis]
SFSPSFSCTLCRDRPFLPSLKPPCSDLLFFLSCHAASLSSSSSCFSFASLHFFYSSSFSPVFFLSFFLSVSLPFLPFLIFFSCSEVCAVVGPLLFRILPFVISHSSFFHSLSFLSSSPPLHCSFPRFLSSVVSSPSP